MAALDLRGAKVPLRAATRGSADWHTDVARTLPGDPAASAEQLAAALRRHPDVRECDARGPTVSIGLTMESLVRIVPELLLGGLPAPVDGTPRAAGPEQAQRLHPVRFAHARARSVSRSARQHGVRPDTAEGSLDEATAADRRLLTTLAGTPAVLRSGRDKTIQAHARGLSSAFQTWFAATRTAPRGREEITSTHRTRLAINDAVALALAAELTAIGLDAPEHL
ncbi:DALR anticodon-binding domain-containing protein [Ruania rhizosphaerae]|uniref:DALR anticodon-binding domain-containing protein n=1 Tax=Ruania rhizosphaerae TaxID=1840413 RepID=UPI00135AF293|nr:DALR anticodon-binding domain-containing protein [Ruania rhizosphaerae]